VRPEFGQAEKLVGSMALLIGGSAAITAVAAARLGLSVALVASVGEDAAGELMLSLLAAEGVDTSSVLVRPGLSTGMTTVLSAGADRAILTALGAMTAVSAADVPGELLSRARHLHVSSYFLLEESIGAGLAGLFAAARRAGVTTSLDTNYDPAGRWGDGRLRAALGEVDLFLPNEAEALGISGESSVERAGDALARRGRAVVIKLGGRGALCWSASGARTGGAPGDGIGAGAGAGAGASGADGSGATLVAVPPVEPVDTTGAGDCFYAGLIAGLLDGLDLPAAVAVGCSAGAASTAAAGGTGAVIDRATAFDRAAAAVFARLGRLAGLP
jgi:sugar/nucleoside kinase (ribokinase family)